MLYKYTLILSISDDDRLSLQLDLPSLDQEFIRKSVNNQQIRNNGVGISVILWIPSMILVIWCSQCCSSLSCTGSSATPLTSSGTAASVMKWCKILELKWKYANYEKWEYEVFFFHSVSNTKFSLARVPARTARTYCECSAWEARVVTNL